MSTTRDLHNAIYEVIQYFHFFKYAPRSEHIYMYLSVKISQKSFNIALEHLVELRKIEKKVYTAQHDIFEVKKRSENNIICDAGEGIFCDRTLRNYDYTLEKLKKVRKLLGTIQKIPEVHLIGLSGSCTMGNADKQDDIDIFIITAPGRLWTARFLILLIAALSGQKRHRTSKKLLTRHALIFFLMVLMYVLIPQSVMLT